MLLRYTLLFFLINLLQNIITTLTRNLTITYVISHTLPIPLSLTLSLSETLRIWNLELEKNKMSPTDVKMGSLKRNIICLEVIYESYYKIYL